MARFELPFGTFGFEAPAFVLPFFPVPLEVAASLAGFFAGFLPFFAAAAPAGGFFAFGEELFFVEFFELVDLVRGSEGWFRCAARVCYVQCGSSSSCKRN